MTSTKDQAEILKQDERGRVRVPQERREALLEEFERSAMSAARFARLSGIKYSTFANWVARRRKAQSTAGSPSGEVGGGVEGKERPRPIRLFEAVSESSVTLSRGLVVELPGGSRVVVGSPVQLQLAAELVVMIAQGRGVRCCSFTGGLKVFVALEPVDLRKSYSGLEGLVSERLGEDLRQGALFVFTNRRHTRLKILYFDGTGLWLLIKRLEEGTFSWPKAIDPQAVKLKLAPEALTLLTDGIDLRGAKLRPWYEREKVS